MYQPATLKRRFAALLYESLLVGAVTTLTAIVSGIINTLIANTMPALMSLTPVLFTVLMLSAWWVYFRLNWVREGQTLPMCIWKIGLTDLSGSRPVAKRLLMRFIWACVFLVFIPLLVYQGAQSMNIHGKTAAGLAILWWILPWGFAVLHPRKQFLYDVLAGTELVDLKEK
ncbi:RDD family protein [Wielerella bovis]|uniref:RDD family protein n=1 Tax=Wielerella bovis TaxID=2917790 RepID=UPI0020195B63|nr:RDD family protein [Wielerella bovis]ULJ61000.1 RDD family protein [Wielerella bovis]